MEPLSTDDASDGHSERCGSYSPSADVSASDSSIYFSDRHFPAPSPPSVGELLFWEHKLNKPQPDLSEVDMMKERFAKLLLGEDMSGGGMGVCTALAVSNAITNLSASVFGELWRLEPLALQKKSMWGREMGWLLCVGDSIVDLIPTVQEFPSGGTFEVMVPCPRPDLYINLPALKKLDAILLGMLDGFRETEFCYVDRGVLVADGELSSSPSFGRPSLRQEEKWWLPCPRVPLNGLSGDGRKRLQQSRNCASQILKAAMSINSGVLTEMELPNAYLEALPKRGRSCLGVTIHRYITADRFSPDCLLDCLDLSSEHHAMEIANRVEAAINVWSLKDRKGHPHHSTPKKSSWGGKVRGFIGDGERSHCLVERAEGLMQSLRLRYPGLPQTDLDMNKIQYNKDVGQAILESYSRVLESLAFNIIARIDDLIYVDDATKRCAAEGSVLKRGFGALPVQGRFSPSLYSIENTPYASPFTTPSYCSPISDRPGRTPPSLSKGGLQGLHDAKLGKIASGVMERWWTYSGARRER